MPGFARELAHIDALNHKRLFRDGLHLGVFEKSLVEFAGTAPGSGKHHENVLVFRLCLGPGTRKQVGGSFLRRCKRGRGEHGS